MQPTLADSAHSPDAPVAPEPAPPVARKRSWAARLLWLIMALVVLGAIGGGVFMATDVLHKRADARPAPAPTPPLPVATRPVRYQDSYEVTARYAGKLEAARETELAFERGGLVTALHVEQGDEVAKGAPIATLDSDATVARRTRLDAVIDQLDARLALAVRTQKRRNSLEVKGLGSTQSLDEARFDAASIRAEKQAIRADMQVLDIDIAKSELRAPFDGTVAIRYIDEGSVVSSGTAVVQLQETARPQARIGVPPAVARQLKVGERYPLATDGTRFDGVLKAMRPDLDPAMRTVTALFEIAPNRQAASGRLPPLGEVVILEVVEQVATRGAWLPIGALLEGRDGLWNVLTIVDQASGPVVGQESVELLHSDRPGSGDQSAAGERVYVRGTLQPNAVVITEGVHRVVRGQRVRPSFDRAGG